MYEICLVHSQEYYYNCCHQTSHFNAKIHQIQFRLGLCPRPRWGSLQRSPDSLAGFKGPTSEGKGRNGRKKRGKGRKVKEGKGKEGGGVPQNSSQIYAYNTVLAQHLLTIFGFYSYQQTLIFLICFRFILSHFTLCSSDMVLFLSIV